MIKKFLRLFFGHNFSRIFLFSLIFNSLLIIFRLFRFTGRVNSFRIYLDSKIGFEVFLGLIPKPFEAFIFRQQIKKNDIVLDIGANIGYYTLLAAELTGEKGRVFAFEPDRFNFRILERNIKLNKCQNVVAVNKAVFIKTGKAKLFLNEKDYSMHSLYLSDKKQNFIDVETISLDDYFKNYTGKINFIKIDIEGAEGWAFQGMKNILEKNKMLKIITEFNPFLLDKSGFSKERFFSFLQKRFRLFCINEKNKKLDPIFSISDLLIKCPIGDYINLLCLPYL